MESEFSMSLAGAVLFAATCLAAGATGAWALLRSRLSQSESICADRESELHESRKSIHEKERLFLEERNRIAIANGEAAREAKVAAFEEGRQLGKVEGDKEHLEQVMALKAEFSAKLAAEVDAAVSEARRRVTAEYELQTKLFTVQISPFIRIVENKGFLKSESQVEAGYQYQLLVNGIPAFEPHSIVERSEVKKEVNEENVKELISIATDLASNAITTFLGSSGGQFVKLAPAIIKRLPKI